MYLFFFFNNYDSTIFYYFDCISIYYTSFHDIIPSINRKNFKHFAFLPIHSVFLSFFGSFSTHSIDSSSLSGSSISNSILHFSLYLYIEIHWCFTFHQSYLLSLKWSIITKSIFCQSLALPSLIQFILHLVSFYMNFIFL